MVFQSWSTTLGECSKTWLIRELGNHGNYNTYSDFYFYAILVLFIYFSIYTFQYKLNLENIVISIIPSTSIKWQRRRLVWEARKLIGFILLFVYIILSSLVLTGRMRTGNVKGLIHLRVRGIQVWISCFLFSIVGRKGWIRWTYAITMMIR